MPLLIRALRLGGWGTPPHLTPFTCQRPHLLLSSHGEPAGGTVQSRATWKNCRAFLTFWIPVIVGLLQPAGAPGAAPPWGSAPPSGAAPPWGSAPSSGSASPWGAAPPLGAAPWGAAPPWGSAPPSEAAPPWGWGSCSTLGRLFHLQRGGSGLLRILPPGLSGQSPGH